MSVNQHESVPATPLSSVAALERVSGFDDRLGAKEGVAPNNQLRRLARRTVKPVRQAAIERRNFRRFPSPIFMVEPSHATRMQVRRPEQRDWN